MPERVGGVKENELGMEKPRLAWGVRHRTYVRQEPACVIIDAVAEDRDRISGAKPALKRQHEATGEHAYLDVRLTTCACPLG